MKTRAINRCLKRTAAKVRRGTFKGRKVKVSFDMAGAYLVPTATCALHVTYTDVWFSSPKHRIRFSKGYWMLNGHKHWLDNPCYHAVAVSYGC